MKWCKWFPVQGIPTMRVQLRFGSVVVLAALAGWAAALAPGADPADDEKLLREARVDPSGPGLLQFFRKRTLTVGERDRVHELVRKLGDDAFEVREQASAELLALGQTALPLLKKALHDSDPEIARRADECLQSIQEGRERTLLLAALRLLRLSQPAGSTAVLLGYLPFAADEQVLLEATESLEQLGIRDGKVDPSLVSALADPDATRRGVAGLLLARQSSEYRSHLGRLLTDPDAGVRFHVAFTLAQTGDPQAIDPLIRVFKDAPPELAWQVEDLLFRLAGDQAVAESLSGGFAAENRQRCQDAWLQWWRTNRGTIDLGRLAQEEYEVGDRVVCELQGGAEGGGRVFAYGSDDRVRWQYDNVAGPIDVQLQPNGRMLVAEINANRVTERDKTGKIYFEKRLDSSPMNSQRLSNGNVFIATYTELLEVAPDGRTVFSYKKPHQRIYSAQKLRNGHILYVTASGQVIDLDPEGKEVRAVPAGDTSNWASVELLPNGHFLVCRCGRHEVVEIDSAGKVFWTWRIEWPTWASQRRNGRVLVACAHTGQVVELDRDGKEHWKQKLSGRPCRVRRY